MKKTVLLVSLLTLSVFKAHAFETNARNAILMDFDTGTYIYTKNHEDKMPPASMSKLMTVYIIFDKLKSGLLSLDDEFTVSENAWRKGGASSGGSTMFLKIGENVKVDDLLKGIVIQSGNDACIVAAENIAGSEEDFAVLMNETAAKIGLKNSIFANSTGLPDENQLMSAEDLALLARVIIKEFPEYYHIFQEKEFIHNGIKQGNRNPLLYSMEGADGLKTGHTEEAGFCLTGSAVRHNRRLIEVIAGLQSNKERSEEAEHLINYGFREFDNYKILSKGQAVGSVRVLYGDPQYIDMVSREDIIQTLPKNQAQQYRFKLIYDEPLKAPVKKGDVIGYIEMASPSGNIEKIDLFAAQDVSKVGFVKKLIENMKYYFGGQK